MPDYLPIARFPLPDDLEPSGIVCAIVPIPDDPQYLETLTGLIDALRFSRNFARDATGIAAATVSRTWERALDSAPIIIGDCMSIVLRQNPENLCQLQQSNDGGETWSLAFDYSLCSQSITVPTPYAGSETQAEDSAAAIVRNLFQEVVSMVDCEQTRSQYIEAATTYLRTYQPDFANPAALGAVYDAACAMDESDLSEYTTDCVYVDKFSELEGCYSETNLSDLLDCLNALLVDWLNETNTDLMEALNQLAAAISGNGYQSLAGGGAGGGGGFGEACPTCYPMLDGTDWSGVFGYPNPPVFIEGEGVRSAGYGGGTAIHIQNGGYAGAEITEIAVLMDTDIIGSPSAFEIKIDDVTVLSTALVSGLHEYVWTGSETVNTIRLFIYFGDGSLGTEEAPAGLIKQVCVEFA